MTWTIAAAVSGYLTVVLGLAAAWVRAQVRASAGEVRIEIAGVRLEVAELRGDVRALDQRIGHLEEQARPGLIRPR